MYNEYFFMNKCDMCLFKNALRIKMWFFSLNQSLISFVMCIGIHILMMGKSFYFDFLYRYSESLNRFLLMLKQNQLGITYNMFEK